MIRTVFWSWQSDLDTAITRDFIKEALGRALKKVSSELQLESANRIELDHDTKGEPGLVEIVSTIFRKIDECEVFVADITPVTSIPSTSGEKKIPNPNVMIELGYALREVGHQRVITVANLAFGGRPEDLPFDLRHRRGAITYSLTSTDDPSRQEVQTKLVNELVGALRVNLEALREDRMLRNPQPALSLEASPEMPAIALIRQDMALEGISTLSEIKAETPVRLKADQTKREFLLQAPFYDFTRPGGGERIKPFREWTQAELDGYNQQVQRFYERYEEYLKAAREHSLFLQRAIIAALVVVNGGTRPATDVGVRLSLPPGVFAYEHDDLPKPPAQPSAPPFAPNGFKNETVVQMSHHSYVGLFDQPRRRIADDHKSIWFRLEKLQHHYSHQFDSFTILIDSEHGIKGFDVEYHITADELPTPKKGVLRFAVEMAP